MSRILALDYGSKRVGVAVSDPTHTLASSLPYLAATPFATLAGNIKKITREQEVVLILIGMPRNMDGSYGPAAKIVQEFVTRLKELVLVPIQTVDERLTTVEASRRLHEAGRSSKAQKNRIDSASAQVLLQSFLDARMPPP
jgi:putative holliday junction resolvase